MWNGYTIPTKPPRGLVMPPPLWGSYQRPPPSAPGPMRPRKMDNNNQRSAPYNVRTSAPTPQPKVEPQPSTSNFVSQEDMEQIQQSLAGSCSRYSTSTLLDPQEKGKFDKVVKAWLEATYSLAHFLTDWQNVPIPQEAKQLPKKLAEQIGINSSTLNPFLKYKYLSGITTLSSLAWNLKFAQLVANVYDKLAEINDTCQQCTLDDRPQVPKQINTSISGWLWNRLKIRPAPFTWEVDSWPELLFQHGESFPKAGSEKIGQVAYNLICHPEQWDLLLPGEDWKLANLVSNLNNFLSDWWLENTGPRSHYATTSIEEDLRASNTSQNEDKSDDDTDDNGTDANPRPPIEPGATNAGKKISTTTVGVDKGSQLLAARNEVKQEN